MGNTVAPRACREAGTAVVGRQRPDTNFVASTAAAGPTAAPPRRVSVAARKQRPGDGEKEKEATRRCGGVRVPRAGGGEAATVVTVKLVLKRKDAEELVARLNAQAARERKARMAELKGELWAAAYGRGSASPAVSCREAWRPRLAPIQEN